MKAYRFADGSEVHFEDGITMLTEGEEIEPEEMDHEHEGKPIKTTMDTRRQRAVSLGRIKE